MLDLALECERARPLVLRHLWGLGYLVDGYWFLVHGLGCRVMRSSLILRLNVNLRSPPPLGLTVIVFGVLYGIGLMVGFAWFMLQCECARSVCMVHGSWCMV